MRDRTKVVLSRSVKDTLRNLAIDRINKIKPDIKQGIDDLENISLSSMKLGKFPFNDKNMKALSQKTIRSRERMSQYNEMASWAQTWKSNLSFSGQFLESFGSRIIFATKTIRVYFFFAGKRKAYKRSNGKNQKGKKISNVDLSQYHIDSGRLSMRPSKDYMSKILKVITDAFNKKR